MDKDMDPELIRDWIRAADQHRTTMEKFLQQRRAADQPANMHAQTGNVSVQVADTLVPRLMLLAVFSAVLCAVLSIITLLGGGMLYLNMKDHLDAIYMMAPQLSQPAQTTQPKGEKTP